MQGTTARALDGMHAAVTGAGSGIGAASALALAATIAVAHTESLPRIDIRIAPFANAKTVAETARIPAWKSIVITPSTSSKGPVGLRKIFRECA